MTRSVLAAAPAWLLSAASHALSPCRPGERAAGVRTGLDSGGTVHSPDTHMRIAWAWPALGMGQFMRIVKAPDAIHGTISRVAGAAVH